MNTGQIIKSKTTERFTTIPNEILRSKELSIAEKGLLSYLLSLPSDWVIYKQNLYESLGDLSGTIDRVFKLLQDKGYIVSVRVIDSLGHFAGWNHVVYDIPTGTFTEVGKSRSRQIPKSDNAEVGKSTPILNTDNTILKTNKNTKGTNEKKEEILKNDGFFLNSIPMDYELSVLDISNTKTFIEATCDGKKITDEQILKNWEAFKIDNFNKKEWYGSMEKVLSHFRHTFKNQIIKNVKNLPPPAAVESETLHPRYKKI